LNSEVEETQRVVHRETKSPQKKAERYNIRRNKLLTSNHVDAKQRKVSRKFPEGLLVKVSFAVWFAWAPSVLVTLHRWRFVVIVTLHRWMH
jgi:hypothetical protein